MLISELGSSRATSSAADGLRSPSWGLRLLGLSVLSLLLLAACTETSPVCPQGSGFYRVDGGPSGSVCIPIPADASSTLDAGGNGTDAGGCGTCMRDTPFCNTSTGQCVACLMDSDCTEAAAARCDTSTGACTTCTDSTQCMGITGTEVCDPSDGACVQCLPGERSACGTNVCDARMRTCTMEMERSGVACSPCVSDEQCQMGQVCVEMSFGSLATAVGTFCLLRQDAPAPGPNGNCTSVPPFAGLLMNATSLDGVTTNVCTLGRSTCLAHAQYRSRDCSALSMQGDDECGVAGQNDGLCREHAAVGAGVLRCTVPCADSSDCPSGGMCNTTTNPNFCVF